MRCPSCGQDVDPAHAFCPNCRTSLQLPAAPSSPYAGGQPPSYSGPEYSQPYHTQPQWADQGYPQPPGYGQPQAYVPQQGYDPTQQHYGVHPPAGVPQETGWSGNYQVLEPGPPPERPRSSMIWLVVAIAALLVVAGAAVAVWKLAAKHPPLASQSAAASTGATSPAQPAADGKAQALAIDQLLNASSASRQKLAPALTAVDGCGDLNGAVTTLQQVTTERDGQVKQGQSLAVDQLTNGTQLRTAVVQALTSSWQADQKYTDWAQAVAQAGCSGHAPHDDNYTAAQAASGSATTAKQQFVALWNPIAKTYGLQNRSESTV